MFRCKIDRVNKQQCYLLIIALVWPKDPFMRIVYDLAFGGLNGCYMA